MKLFRIFCMILAAIVIVTACPVMPVSALSDKDITAPSAVLMDALTGEVLYEKSPHEIRPCASITKVMTLLLVMEALESGKLSLDDNITASAHAASMGGSDIWLEQEPFLCDLKSPAPLG